MLGTRRSPFPVILFILSNRLRKLGAQRVQRGLPLLPDHVDLGVVGDGLQRDVRHALVDEALPDVATDRRFRRLGAG